MSERGEPVSWTLTGLARVRAEVDGDSAGRVAGLSATGDEPYPHGEPDDDALRVLCARCEVPYEDGAARRELAYAYSVAYRAGYQRTLDARVRGDN